MSLDTVGQHCTCQCRRRHCLNRSPSLQPSLQCLKQSRRSSTSPARANARTVRTHCVGEAEHTWHWIPLPPAFTHTHTHSLTHTHSHTHSHTHTNTHTHTHTHAHALPPPLSRSSHSFGKARGRDIGRLCACRALKGVRSSLKRVQKPKRVPHLMHCVQAVGECLGIGVVCRHCKPPVVGVGI